MSTFLISGATGTFGRAMIPRLLARGATRVVALARHEKEMYELERLIGGHPAFRPFIGDVRDLSRLTMAFRGIEHVIHAAAMKRIEQCERDPFEAVATNVHGSENVIRACLQSGVRKAILLSTDKACNPVSFYGATKALAERLFLAANNIRGENGTMFAVVRYGNVWGSRGSVVPLWREQLARGQPITVTNPDATRFFMKIDLAVDLVLDTLADMCGGELVVPRLPAYRLADVAEAMGAQIKVVGMARYEKVAEELGQWRSDEVRRMTVAELKQILAEDAPRV